jgi:wobble nucleotide-excising tRNase
MITKILEISGLGLFDDFKWGADISEFRKYNVFYGWNYSGKTTLSRVFGNFEANLKHPDYPECSAKIMTEDGVSYDCDTWGCPHPIKVFNTDFIETNLKWDAQIEPILLIGEENIRLQEELRELRERQESKTRELRDASAEAQSIESRIDTQITAKASHIKTTLSIVNYTRKNFLPIVEQVLLTGTLLDEEAIKKHIDTYYSTDKRAEISPIPLPTFNLDPLILKVNDLLQLKIVSKTIQKLQKDPVLAEWVKQGKNIHSGKDTCEFCGNQLPVDLIDRLNDHFSDNYDAHLRQLGTAINELESTSIRLAFFDKARFYPQFSGEYCALKSEVDSLISNYNENLDTMIKALNEKIRNPFNSFDLPPYIK